MLAAKLISYSDASPGVQKNVTGDGACYIEALS